MSYAECFRNKWPNFGIVFYAIPQFGHPFLNTLYIRVTCVRARVCVYVCVIASLRVIVRSCAYSRVNVRDNGTKRNCRFNLREKQRRILSRVRRESCSNRCEKMLDESEIEY